MIHLFIKLMLAHILGDFVLQPAKWVTDKEAKTYKSKYLYWHIAIHFALLILLLKANSSYWIGILSITISHYLIDLLKLQFRNEKNNRLLFVLDQLAHIAVITVVAYAYAPVPFDLSDLFNSKVLLFISCLLGITSVSSVIMKTVIAKWQLEEDTIDESLENAGAYIGILERLFVFAFILMGYWAGIGFLIAAKSVFRFGDLSKAKDRKLTEYILIGTLLSFGLAFMFSMAYKFALTLL
ncbi:DUF3307 domain-containing protein [Mangrovimonas xylaniphaga]|uniref:DUF3307 domain-containing protein n=1 Tax=Mangrovimonas xylaniphaga TaxID=1645915 RepID=UPI0006B43744|nr:DUF3307 domain-containing protein [Mangrovimonas xylaniphaga]